MARHTYIVDCTCDRCTRERTRRANQNRTPIEVMTDWNHSRNRRRARIAREWLDAYESGRPMSSDDY